jgi:hypothetical protein
MGLYARQLKRYQRTFGPDRVRVLLHEDLRTDAQGVVREIFARIGVDPTREVRTDVRRNVSGTAVSPTLQHLLSRPHPVKDSLKRVVPVRVRDAVVQRLRAANVRPAPAMAQDTQRELRSFFRSDVLELQDMIGRDLATWLA